MPNWCRNNVSIQGNADDVAKFMDTVTKWNEEEGMLYYDFTAVNPLPTEMEDLHQGGRNIDDVYVDAWYEDADGVRPLLDITKQELIDKYGVYAPIDWQYDYWGTKWGDLNTELQSDNTTKDIRKVRFWFESAWGQPYMLLNDIATKFNLTIRNDYEVEGDYEEQTTTFPIPDYESLVKSQRLASASMRDSIRNKS